MNYKALFISAMAVAALLASCAKNEAATQPEVDPVPETKAQAISFTTNLKNSASTKAALDKWDATELYIFGFNDKNDTYKNDFIFDVKATTQTAAALTDPDLKDTFTVIKDTQTGEPYYYGQADEDKYSFYGYHLGYAHEKDPAIDTENNKVTLAVDIKGDNDLLLATTDKEEDAFLADGSMVNPKYLYTAYSSRQGVIPNLVFKHQLARFVFKVKVGGNVDLTANPMQVDNIELTSKGAGSLVIAGDEPGLTLGDEDKVWLSQIDQTADPKTPFTTLSKDAYNMVSESGIMVSPDDTCTMKITYTETFDWDGDGTANDKKTDSWTQLLKPENVVDAEGKSVNAEAFEAGKKYIVNVVIYGLEEVKVSVTLTEWDYVGDIWVDKDNKDDGIVYPITVGDATKYIIITKDGDDYYVKYEDGTSIDDGTYSFTRPVTIAGGSKSGFTVADGKITAWTDAS